MFPGVRKRPSSGDDRPQRRASLWLAFRLAGTAFVLLLQSCGGTERRQWKEEVRLHGGEVVVLDRGATRLSGFPFHGDGLPLDDDIEYAPLNVVWHFHQEPYQASSLHERPSAFEIVGDSAYLMVMPLSDDRVCKQPRRPGDYRAIFYRWIGGSGTRVAQAEVPTHLMSFNLTGDYWDDSREARPALITWSEKALKGKFDPGHPRGVDEFFGGRPDLRCGPSGP